MAVLPGTGFAGFPPAFRSDFNGSVSSDA